MKETIKKQYIESFKDLCETGSIMFVVLLIFLGGIIIGLTHPSLYDGNLSVLKEIAEQLSGKSVYVIIGTIFLRNSFSALISVVSGPLLGIVPAMGAFVNGLLIGLMFTHVSEANKIKALLHLFPHGLFELPAIFIAWGIGIWQGIWFFQKDLKSSFRERRNKALKILLIIVVPLLLIAAIMEGISIHFLLQK